MQATAKLEPLRQHPSSMDRVLAELRAERKKERKARARSSKKRKSDEVWEKQFSEKMERYINEPPDFRTEGEKWRDARQEAVA